MAEPGAGLPLHELIFVRVAFGIARTVMTPPQATARFRAETNNMLRLVGSLDIEDAQREVLIPRVVGIEDSSRNWSALMTLGHLVITTPFIQAIAERLVRGEELEREVRIQDVKPSPQQSAATIKLFGKLCSRYASALEKLPNLRTQKKHRHPWFGPLDAHGWHCLAAIHHTIHRRQIERIIATLKRGQKAGRGSVRQRLTRPS